LGRISFVLRPLSVEEEQKKHGDTPHKTRPQVRVVQSSGPKLLPETAGRQQRKDQREKGETQESVEREPSPCGPRHFSLARRERTNESTVSARAGGISFGFNIFRVLPVAR
jgi:hypothetical protein